MAGLETFGREEFMSGRFRHRPGEHVTIVGPTGCGKSWFAWQILERIAHPRHQAVVLLKKPRDYATELHARRLGFDTVRQWPPPFRPFRAAPPGFVLHPPTRFDPEIDRPTKAAAFRAALLDSYRRGGRSIFVDDAFGIAEILKLREIMIEMWTELRAMNGELLAAFQKPSHVPQWAFNQAEHLVLFHDPDRRNRIRFSEIGGIDTDLLQETVLGLKRHQALYVRRDGPAACIVDK